MSRNIVTYAAEIDAEYRQSGEHRDDALPICPECHRSISKDEESEPGAHVDEWLHAACWQRKAQREEEAGLLLGLQRVHTDLAETLREWAATGHETPAGVERRALAAEASRLLLAAVRVGVHATNDRPVPAVAHGKRVA